MAFGLPDRFRFDQFWEATRSRTIQSGEALLPWTAAMRYAFLRYYIFVLNVWTMPLEVRISKHSDPVVSLGHHCVAAICGLGGALDHGNGLSGLGGGDHRVSEIAFDLVNGLH